MTTRGLVLRNLRHFWRTNLAVIAGVASYFRLGRSEDPSFVIKTMIVQAAWPGASVEETMKQVTERLERQLLTYGPYFFPDLVDTTAADEETAIHAGQIQPTRIDYVGTRH